MGTETHSMADVDRLTHEPSRSVTLAVLAIVDNADFIYLQHETRLTNGNLSVHLSKLEEAGYIIIEKTYRGKIPLTLCRITRAGRQAFDIYRNQFKMFIENTKE